MRKIVLANIDYRTHMTDEGDQFQRGLEAAGWTLVGKGYQDDCKHVPTILDRYRPTHVMVHDKRDWDPDSKISFRKDIGFEELNVLMKRDDIVKAVLVKDAATFREYMEEFVREVKPAAIVHYYDLGGVRDYSPYLFKCNRIRTWHTIDSAFARSIDLTGPRKRAVLTGARGRRSYPLRMMVRHHIRSLRPIEYKNHPGYGNVRCHTPDYLKMLAGYRIHIATASRWGFALRKIIESVAVGATPITNLPAHDVLPEIDGALVRIPSNAQFREIRQTVERADTEWNLEERLRWAEKAWDWYDWRTMGERLSDELSSLETVQASTLGSTREQTDLIHAS